MAKAQVAISLGSNQGNPCEHVKHAASELANAGLENVRLSPLYKTSPVECPDGAPDFINAALTATTSLSAHEVLSRCRAIEKKMGRPLVRGYHEDRVIDLDLLMYDDVVIDSAELVLPHPEMANRLFVLAPLNDVASTWTVPLINKTVHDCLETLDAGDEHVLCFRD